MIKMDPAVTELPPSAYRFHMPHLQPGPEGTLAIDLAAEGVCSDLMGATLKADVTAPNVPCHASRASVSCV